MLDYFNKPNKDDDEAHKTVIIETAAKFIKSDVKCIVASLNDEYPKFTDIKSESAIRYLPPSLHCLLQNLLERIHVINKQVLGKQLFKQFVQEL